MSKKLVQLLHTPLERRQALKVMGGTVAGMTLAACGVAPSPEPTPDTMTNTVLLRGKVKNLVGRDRERLRAITAFLEAGNLQEVDVLGQYWTDSKPLAFAQSGRDFIGDGFDMIVIAKGDTSAAVRSWAKQWATVVDIDTDEVETVSAWLTAQNVLDSTSSFLVFERRAGLITPEQIIAAPSPRVYIAAHHTLVNDRNRQVLVVHAPSRIDVSRWVKGWGAPLPMQILALSDLSSQLKRCQQVTTCEVPAATWAVPALATPSRTQVVNYNPNGVYYDNDPKFGTAYVRNQGSGQFLAVDSSGKVVTVEAPSTGDKWTFSYWSALRGAHYVLQHQGTQKYLTRSGENVVLSTTAQGWKSDLIASKQYVTDDGQALTGAKTGDGVSLAVSANDTYSNWEQWDVVHQPSATEEKLDDIVTTTTYDAPWPEDSYTGDMAQAYGLIVQILANHKMRPPRYPGGVTDLSFVKDDPIYPKEGAPLRTAADLVYTHLDVEITCFNTLKDWYGDSGHVRTFLMVTTISNLSLIAEVQDMSAITASSGAKFYLALFFSVLIGAMAAGSVAGAGVINAILGGIWRQFSSGTGNSSNVLDTTFANLEYELNATFNSLLTQCETTHTTIAGNWGKLSTFQAMVTDGTLTWPKDDSEARAIAARQFEISLWQSVTRVLWTIYSDSVIVMPPKIDPSGDLDSPWDLVVQVPVTYRTSETHHPLASGWRYETAQPGLFGQQPSPLVTQRLLDDKELGIKLKDIYLGRNGWQLPPDPG